MPARAGDSSTTRSAWKRSASPVLLCPRCGGRRQIVGVYPGGPRLRELLRRLAVGDYASRPPPQPAG
jgi:hypothetical protein